MSTTLTRDWVQTALEPIVKEAGETYVASDCVYFRNDGTACCLVGQLLPGLGVTAMDLEYYDLNYEVSATELFASDYMRLDKKVEITPEASLTLQAVQALQDHGHPWSKVLAFVESLSDEDLRSFILVNAYSYLYVTISHTSIHQAYLVWETEQSLTQVPAESE